MIESIGIIGAGQMGSGIAYVCIDKGYKVTLIDKDSLQLDKALQSIREIFKHQIEKGRMTSEQSEQAFALMNTSTDLQAIKNVGLVVEAVNENLDLKSKIFSALKASLNPAAIIVSNTSSLSISQLAATTDRPQQFMGLHFMNPASQMPLVELIKGDKTNDKTFSEVQNLSNKLGKTAIVSANKPGFIVNRILIPMINEAIFALYENVGTVEDIDTGMKLGANHPMGPLKLADFIGLDTCLAIMQVLYQGFSNDKYQPCPLLVQYVNQGRLGRKSGRGFYEYP